MAISNFDMQVLIPNNGPFYYDVDSAMALSVCRSYNNSLGRIIKKFPGKFFGLVTLPLQAPALAVQELDRAVRDLGLHAPVCYTSVNDKDIDVDELWLHLVGYRVADRFVQQTALMLPSSYTPISWHVTNPWILNSSAAAARVPQNGGRGLTVQN